MGTFNRELPIDPPEPTARQLKYRTMTERLEAGKARLEKELSFFEEGLPEMPNADGRAVADMIHEYNRKIDRLQESIDDIQDEL